MNADFWWGVVGNVVASAVVGTLAYVWKIRPHHKAVEGWIGGIHDRLDAAGVPDVGQPSESGAHSHTETFRAVTE